MTSFLNGSKDNFAPRWIILMIDVIIATISYVLATIIRFNFELEHVDLTRSSYHLFVVVAIRALFFVLTKTHSGIVRHTTMEDAFRIFKSISLSTASIVLLSLSTPDHLAFLKVPLSITLIDTLLVLFGILLTRLSIKSTFEFIQQKSESSSVRKVIIYGAGTLGIVTKNTIIQDRKKKVEVLCFIDDNPQKNGKTIEGVPVFSREKAIQKHLYSSELLEDIEIILAINRIDHIQKDGLVDEFLEMGAHLKIVPPMEQWIEGQLNVNQIQEIKIEDLLNRKPILLNDENIQKSIRGKRIFVSGAAGSIGSEIARQIAYYRPSTLVLIDHSESALYDLESELKRLNLQNADLNIVFEVGNVKNQHCMTELFERHHPQVVFHAAAYKHVPLMEKNPFQAVYTNVGGTKVMADLASGFQVEKFVLISTDKAVNPTNVMGATKRMAEMYVQGLNNYQFNTTQFIVTRFGNVLGSNGSVIPLFKKQIEKGGPVTVTHPDIIRYFMTIPEACQLVLEAYTMGSGGEIFVFDMGEPVKIAKLAQKMIRLSGYVPDVDIMIKYVGLRDGEKLYEELLGHGENEQPTHHSKIKIAKVETKSYMDINLRLTETLNSLETLDKFEIVAFLKLMIPEYISNNSEFNELDGTVTVPAS